MILGVLGTGGSSSTSDKAKGKDKAKAESQKEDGPFSWRRSADKYGSSSRWNAGGVNLSSFGNPFKRSSRN